MRRMFIVAMMMAGLVAPAMAIAQSANAAGGARGGAMGGSLMTHGGTSMMGGDRAMLDGATPGQHMSEGEVRKVDSAAGKLTLRHGPLENMDMPAMTMVFRVKDPGWLQQLRVGDKVRFVAERVDGNLTVTALQAEAR